MSFIDAGMVEQYVFHRREVERAAELFFMAYKAAFPQRDHWESPWAWQGTCGTIEVDETEVSFTCEHSSHGETDYYSLRVPLSALYDPEYLPREMAKEREREEKNAAESARKIAAEQTFFHEKERAEYARLKAKFEGTAS